MSELAREADSDSAEVKCLYYKGEAKTRLINKTDVNSAFLLPRSAGHTSLRTPPFWDEAYALSSSNTCAIKKACHMEKGKGAAPRVYLLRRHCQPAQSAADCGAMKQQMLQLQLLPHDTADAANLYTCICLYTCITHVSVPPAAS